MDLKIRVMKIKGLLFGLFACAALAACTNDDIVENNGKGEQEKVKANLTLVIGAATNSSRAAGDAENGDDINTGTVAESAVSDAVVVLSPQFEGGAEVVSVLNKSQLNQETVAGATVYMPNIKVTTSGEYKVLVVLNPTSGIKTIANGASIAKYNEIAEYVYNYDGTGINELIGTLEDPRFMMVNQREASVNVQSNNSEDPTTLEVAVERVAAKITFVPSSLTIGQTEYSNRYALQVNTAEKVIAETREGYYVASNGQAYHITGLNKATASGKTIWIWNGTRAFEDTGKEYSDTDLLIYNEIEMPADNAFEYEYKTTDGEQTWYVQLDKYALTNLSNATYAARHIANAEFTSTQTFGLLDNTFRYIMDPNTIAKNNNVSGDYFYNKAADVEKAKVDNVSGDTGENPFFAGLPTAAESNTLGTCLTYCLENSIKVESQNPQSVTGIVFRGQICNAEGIPMGTIYKKDNNFYTDKEQLYAVYGRDVTDYETYEEGKCYYYSKGIEHSSTDTYMKNVIMRNNIYVLKVKSFKEIGSATITIPDGTEDTDKNFYLKLTSTIHPWQVRFNNIEF